MLIEQLAGLVHERVRVVADLGLLPPAGVLRGMRLGIGDHPLDLLGRHGRLPGDGDRLLLAGRAVLRGHVDDAVGIDVERHLDLRDASRRRRQADQLELAQCLVAGRHFPLALQHVDLHGGLAVFGGGEHLRPARRDRGVAIDEARHHAALGLDAQAERCDIQQQHVGDVALEHPGLDGRAHRDHLVGIHALVGFTAGELGHQLLHGGHARGAAHQDHVIDVGLREARIIDGLLERRPAALQQVERQLLELGPAQLVVEVEGAAVGCRDERQVDLGGLLGRQVLLGLLGRLPQTLAGHCVAAQVDPMVALERRHQPRDHSGVPVVAAKVSVTGGGLHLEDAVADLEHRHVERAAAEVEHQDRLVLGFLVEAVRQRGGRGLVDDAQYVEAGDLSRLGRGGPLRVVEVRRHGDDRFGHRVAEVLLGVELQLLQHPGRDLLRRVVLVIDGLAPGGAHVPLDRGNGAVGVCDRLPLGDLAGQHLTIAGKRHDRRGRAVAFGVGNDGGLAALHRSHHRVRGSEVNSDSLGHRCAFPCVVSRPKSAKNADW